MKPKKTDPAYTEIVNNAVIRGGIKELESEICRYLEEIRGGLFHADKIARSDPSVADAIAKLRGAAVARFDLCFALAEKLDEMNKVKK